MKPALALDMDDIIFPFMQSLVPFHNSRYNTSLTADDYFTFDFYEVWGGTPMEAFRRVHEFFEELDVAAAGPGPIAGADDAINALAEHYRLFIVTSRADELHAVTMDWLGHHFPKTFEDVFLCNSYLDDGRPSKRTKGSVVEQLNAVGLVDDSASHIREVANQGRKALLFGDYAWNRGQDLPDSVIRVRDWTEVTRVLL